MQRLAAEHLMPKQEELERRKDHAGFGNKHREIIALMSSHCSFRPSTN